VSKLQSHRWTTFGDFRLGTDGQLHFYLYRWDYILSYTIFQDQPLLRNRSLTCTSYKIIKANTKFVKQLLLQTPTQNFIKVHKVVFDMKHMDGQAWPRNVYCYCCCSLCTVSIKTLYSPVYVTIIHRDFIINSSPELGSHCTILFTSCGTQVAVHSVHHPLLNIINIQYLLLFKFQEYHDQILLQLFHLPLYISSLFHIGFIKYLDL
jgi:hypothetical protein